MKKSINVVFSFLLYYTTAFAQGPDANMQLKEMQISSAPTHVGFSDSTVQLMALVMDADKMIREKGEEAFAAFREKGSRWRQGETYIFILDMEGNMVVHPDAELEGKNQLELKDVNGKYIIRGLLRAVTVMPYKPEGWYHYQWPEPGGLMPRWKSSFVRVAITPKGKRYVVGSGMYNDRMEPEFVIEMVRDAVGQIETLKKDAFDLLHDMKGPFRVKDTYVFVIDEDGTELVNPGFPNLEGRNVMDVKDTEGKMLVQEMFSVMRTLGSGWVDYMWPKPGESVSTQKSTYVSGAKLGNKTVLVGCGVYLSDAPKAEATAPKMKAPELMALVREAADVFSKSGEQAFPEFRMKGSRWFKDDTYFFVWTLDGVRKFHAADPKSEGKNVSDLRDVLNRPIGKLFLEAGASASGEGWAHYMYPEPGQMFPAWKSTFVKRVTFPDGKQYLIGCGIYHMQMDKAFIEDLVNRAADLIAKEGKKAFPILRDKSGPFLFMSTYIFVQSPEGVELVNGVHPNLEGRNLIDLKDLKGKPVIRLQNEAAMKKGSAWLEHYWYTPGDNTPALKQTFVRKVEHEGVTYIVGSGLYPEMKN
ncbi:MAG: cache domain-containing protein [Bacteroidia bacterium]|jgi:signal transduction histidine kinase